MSVLADLHVLRTKKKRTFYLFGENPLWDEYSFIAMWQCSFKKKAVCEGASEEIYISVTVLIVEYVLKDQWSYCVY